MFDRAIEDLSVLTGNIIEDLFYIIALGVLLISFFVGLIVGDRILKKDPREKPDNYQAQAIREIKGKVYSKTFWVTAIVTTIYWIIIIIIYESDLL